MEEVGAVGDAEGFVDVVIGDEDANALIGEAEDDVLDFFYGDRVYTGEGFIQEEKLRFSGEGSGDFGAAAFAAGELEAEAFSDVAERKFVQKLLDAFLNGFFGEVAPQF